MTDNELYHYGVLGMKWGVRRYQNADGSLTPAGRKHAQELADKEARKAVKKDRKYAMKNRSLLSDEELNSRIVRLQKERLLADLSRQELTPGRYKAGQIMEKYGNQIIGTAIGVGVGASLGKVVGGATDRWLSTKGYKVKDYRDGVPHYGKD